MSALAREVAPFAIHASAVVVGERAAILRGASGAGKSALALALVQAGRAQGRFARLVGDDRLILRSASTQLIVAPHPKIAGRVERRFVGIAATAHEDEAVASLVVDLVAPDNVPELPRIPSPDACWTTIGGVRLRRIMFPTGHAGSVEAVLHALHRAAE